MTFRIQINEFDHFVRKGVFSLYSA